MKNIDKNRPVMVSGAMGYDWKVDNSKSKKALGMQSRPLEESIIDFFQQMLDQGIVKAK